MRFGKHTDFEWDFLLENMMGPNALRLAEELVGKISLDPGMRLLDLGCGTGLTSVFFAQELGARVFAVDLWIEPTPNYERFKQFGLEEAIIPLHAEAHALPFAHGYFDAVFSIDAFHHFGAEAGYLDEHIIPLLRPGGILAVSVPGLLKDFGDDVPDALKPFWQENMNMYSAGWWRKLWEGSPQVTVEACFSHACHREAWEDWLQSSNPYAQRDVAMMEAEGGQYFDTIGLVARVRMPG